MTCINTGHLKSYDQLDAEDRALRLGSMAISLARDCQRERLPANHSAWWRARDWLRQSMRLRQDAGLPPSQALAAHLSLCSTPGHSAKDESMNEVNKRLSPIAPSVGRLVLLTLPTEHPRAGEIRPAIVVRVNGDVGEHQSLNLAVLLDGPNDRENGREMTILWLGSRNYDATGQCGTWRWMDYQMGQAAKTDQVQEKARAMVEEAMVAMGLRMVQVEQCNAALVNRVLELSQQVGRMRGDVQPQAEISADGIKVTPRGVELRGPGAIARNVETEAPAERSPLPVPAPEPVAPQEQIVDQVGGPDASAPASADQSEPLTDGTAEDKAQADRDADEQHNASSG